jgi:hypothetical protein
MTWLSARTAKEIPFPAALPLDLLRGVKQSIVAALFIVP